MFRGNITMKGYLNNPQATREAFAGGWFHSGDLAVQHPDGFIKIKDRSNNIILTIMVVAATPEDERDFGVEGCG